MSFIDRIDPELVHALDLMPAERFAAIGEDPPKARQLTEEYQSKLRDALPNTDVTIEETSFPGPDCEIPVVIYQPPTPAPRGGLLWMHGGGYIVGTARADYHGVGFAEHAGCTVVSVEYRLAPESTYKESIADCFAALNWMADNAGELGIDRERIAIGGGPAIRRNCSGSAKEIIVFVASLTTCASPFSPPGVSPPASAIASFFFFSAITKLAMAQAKHP